MHASEDLQKRIEALEEALEKERNVNKTIEAELRETSELLKATLNQLPVVICGIDNDGGIVFLNKEFERVTGYTAGELLTRPDVADYLFPDRTPNHNPNASEREWNLKSKKKKERVISWSEIQDCPIQGWDKWKVGLDITHLKQLERLRDDVESIVHHDLKSPLGAIIGLSSWLLEDPNIPSHQGKALRNIERSGERMLRMLENSLALYRIEAGEFEYKPERVNLSHLMKEIFEQLQGLASSHYVTPSCSIDGVPLEQYPEFIVFGVESLLENLLTNLIKNAIEASPQASEVTVTITHSDTTLYIDTHNSGEIPPPIHDKFFERFVTHGKNKGTGLGTYSAKLITEAHNGTLRFQTSEEDGTHLFLQLPLLSEQDLHNATTT